MNGVPGGREGLAALCDATFVPQFDVTAHARSHTRDAVDDGVRCANARQAARAQLDPQDVNDLRELMAAVTGDEKLVDEKFSQHYRMKGQIVDAFEKRNVHEVATLEQLLVTGCDADGAKPNAKEVERVVRGLMQDDRLTCVRGRSGAAVCGGRGAARWRAVATSMLTCRRGANIARAHTYTPTHTTHAHAHHHHHHHPHRHEDQARVLMLFILCAKSVEPSVRNELLALSRVTPRQQTALLNLVNLHVPTTRKVRRRHEAPHRVAGWFGRRPCTRACAAAGKAKSTNGGRAASPPPHRGCVPRPCPAPCRRRSRAPSPRPSTTRTR